ncbi:hypothetical protein [Roseateles sp. L2-2]|uniref:hypothetical protein n=1 Tax=Roseateles sp. L2-2 TaxID=3422597 RepID=UPI003D35F5D2
MTMNVQWERASNLVMRLPPVGPRPVAEFDEVVALLAEPTALFGPASDVCDGTCAGRSVSRNWSRIAEDLRAVLNRCNLRHSHAIQMLQVAAQVLAEHALKLCNCPPRVTMSPRGLSTPSVRYELQIDAPEAVARDVTESYLARLTAMDLQNEGVRISFNGNGEGGQRDKAVLERARRVVAALPPLAPRPQINCADLAAVLLEPSSLFGKPTTSKCISSEEGGMLDAETLAEVLYQITCTHNVVCSTIMELLQMAAALARERSLRIRDGRSFEIQITDFEDEELSLRHILCLDATSDVADNIDDELLWQLCELDTCRSGFEFSFSGERMQKDRQRSRDVMDDQDPMGEGARDASVLP